MAGDASGDPMFVLWEARMDAFAEGRDAQELGEGSVVVYQEGGPGDGPGETIWRATLQRGPWKLASAWIAYQPDGGKRIEYVHVPPRLRRKGYATRLVCAMAEYVPFLYFNRSTGAAGDALVAKVARIADERDPLGGGTL